MSNASRMLQILDLFSLAHLALKRAVRYEPVGIKANQITESFANYKAQDVTYYMLHSALLF